MEYKIKHLLYVPFTGLGLYNGFRGNRWLKNRIKIFKQFVIPSLLAQTNQNFTTWISWRYEEKNNHQVKEFKKYIDNIGLKNIFTYSGLCFYDDKYPNNIATERLINSLHGSLGDLINETGEIDYVLMTIQPSDDCYWKFAVEQIQNKIQNYEAIGFQQGYICNYKTLTIREWNPLTNPPFYTIKFPREIFIDPLKHIQYTSLKKDINQYKLGTPCPSHEYIADCLKYGILDDRGFLIGTHGENISTVFNHPFSGKEINNIILVNFGLSNISSLKINYSWRKKILKLLPPKIQKKIRYWFGEKIYEFFRN